MTFSNPEIYLLTGFCGLPFGSTKADAEKLFGKPEEVQLLEDEVLNNSSVVFHYWDAGYSLFFDKRRQELFTSVELDNRDAILYENKIFSLREKELTELMLRNGHRLSDSEVHEWGEKRLSFDSAGLDCYFENNRLATVNFGLIEAYDSYTIFQN